MFTLCSYQEIVKKRYLTIQSSISLELAFLANATAVSHILRLQSSARHPERIGNEDGHAPGDDSEHEVGVDGSRETLATEERLECVEGVKVDEVGC